MGTNKKHKQDEERVKISVNEYMVHPLLSLLLLALILTHDIQQKRRGSALINQHAATKKPERKT